MSNCSEHAKKLREMGFLYDAIARLIEVDFAYLSRCIRGKAKMSSDRAKQIEWLSLNMELLINNFKKEWKVQNAPNP